MGGAQRLTSSPMEQQQTDLDPEEQLMLKRSIACHPIFLHLKDAHLNCLKVCMGDEVDAADREDREDCRGNITVGGCSELDLFMESYYLALVELKRAIREPMKEASEFIGLMQDLLLELSQPVLPMASLQLQCESMRCNVMSEESIIRHCRSGSRRISTSLFVLTPVESQNLIKHIEYKIADIMSP